MRLRFSARAVRHLHGIEDYIRAQSPSAALDIGRRIRRAAERLKQFPAIGHKGAQQGTREIGVQGLPYIIVHQVDSDDTITVLGIYHAAQLRPGQEPPTDDS